MSITVNQALALSKLLSDAASAAVAANSATIDLTEHLDALDDEARADQMAALAELQSQEK